MLPRPWLRTQTTLEDFAGRYEALSNALDEARKTLEELERAAQSGDAEKAELAAALGFE